MMNRNGKKMFHTSDVFSGFARLWLWREYA